MTTPGPQQPPGPHGTMPADHRYRRPPNWPAPPDGWTPHVGWSPDPSWPAPPPGWRVWVPEREYHWQGRRIAAGVAAVLALVVVGVAVQGSGDGSGTGTGGGTAQVGAAARPTPSGTPCSVAPSDVDCTGAMPTDGTGDDTSDDTSSDDTASDGTSGYRAPKSAYEPLSARHWKRIARNADDHIGETYVVYGQVTQADAATGKDNVRADVGGVPDPCSYGFCDYPTNTLLTGRKTNRLVEDDTFRARVTVLGSLDYDTALGGSTTAPLLSVDYLTRTGSV